MGKPLSSSSLQTSLIYGPSEEAKQASNQEAVWDDQAGGGGGRMNEGTCFQDIRSIMNGRYDGEEGGGAVVVYPKHM